MDYEEIKKLIDNMGDSKVDELAIEFPDGIKISMKKNTPVVKEVAVNAVSLQNNAISNEEISKEEKKEEYLLVKSPMVGTFYSKPSPSAASFVKVGDKVKKGDTLCVIEAMKLMNEIESEQAGEIIEICVKEEQMVEYGQVLFKIK